MRTTRVERPNLLEGGATGGLAGTGRWRLFEEGGVPRSSPSGRCARRGPGLNLIAPIARPVFKGNHDYVMRNGGRGLAKLLGARLIAID